MLFYLILLLIYILSISLLIFMYKRQFIKQQTYKSFNKRNEKKKYTTIELNLLDYFRNGFLSPKSNYYYKKILKEIHLYREYLDKIPHEFIKKGGIYLWFHPVLDELISPIRILVLDKKKDIKGEVILEYLVESPNKTELFIEDYTHKTIYFVPKIFTENMKCFAFIEEIGFLSNILQYFYIKFVLFFYKNIYMKKSFNYNDSFLLYINLWDKLFNINIKYKKE